MDLPPEEKGGKEIIKFFFFLAQIIITNFITARMLCNIQQ